MRKSLLILSLMLAATATMLAQPRLAYTEFGFGVGTLNQSSDIATSNTVGAMSKEVRPNFMAFAKRNFNDWFALGIMSSYGWTEAEDANHDNQRRGLSVHTTLFQFNPFLEINFLKFGKYHLDRKFTIYTRLGAGFLAYNPTPESVSVYPDYFEVRPDAYKSLNTFVEVGLRFRIAYSTILTVGVDFHNSGADDLDGVLHKLPGEQGKNDTYGGLNISLSKALF